MANGGFDLNATVADPDFRQLPGTEKIKVLEHLDPDFRGLPLAEKAKVMASVVSPVPRAPEAPEKPGSFFGTLVSDIAAMPGGIVQAARHPLETGVSIAAQQFEQAHKAREAASQGRKSEAFGHGLAAALPVVGPAAAQAGEEFGERRWGPGAAHTLELLGPEATRLVPRKFGPLVPEAKVPAVEKQAIRATERAGVPVSVGQRTGRVGLQKVERNLQNLPGAERRTSEFFINQQEQLAQRGRKLAGQAAPTRANAYESGAALQDRLRQRIKRLKGHADNLYDSIRKDTEAAKQTVQTGTRQVPGAKPQATLTPAGMPRTVPVYSVLETPVELEPMRQALRPLYDDLTRSMPEARRANSPAFAALKDLMTSDQQHMNAMDFDRSLSAIKALARDGESPYLSTQSQRVAKAIIGDGEKQLKQALGKVSPDIETRLTRARQAVRAYHDTAELLQDLHDEPASVYSNLTTGGDRALETMKDLRRVAPREVQTIGRTYLEGMIDKATAEGGFRRAEGVMADWKRMGPETKRLLFGDPLTKDLNDFFLAAKKLAPAEGSATAGRLTALVPYGIASEVLRSLITEGPVRAGMELAGGVGGAYVLPNIAARMLFTPGGAKLLEKAITLPINSAAFRQTARAIGARAALAQEQGKRDRGETAPPQAPSPATGQPRAAVTPRNLGQALTSAAERHQLPPALLHAVARVESSDRPGAVSPKGATGLMQLMPATARQYGVRDIRNPIENIEGSARLLRHLWTKYRGNVALVAAAYNAGEGAVDRHGGVPPYRETRQYVQRVMSRMAG